MLLVDLEQGRIISDEEIKSDMANALPYQQWLDENLVTITSEMEEPEQIDDLLFKQKAFGYTYEDIQK